MHSHGKGLEEKPDCTECAKVARMQEDDRSAVFMHDVVYISQISRLFRIGCSISGSIV